MPQKFSTNSHRLDPYKNFKFRVKIGNEFVAGLSKMSALKRSTEVIEWREAGDASVVRKLPGLSSFEPITLEGGLSHDTMFTEWANTVNHPNGSPANSLINYRKDIEILVMNLQGMPALKFKVKRAWVSEFQALPEMDASGNAVAIETIKLEHEGFERMTIPEPTES